MKTKLMMALMALMALMCTSTALLAQAPKGEIMGSAVVHDATSAKAVVAGAQVALPASVTGGAAFLGAFRDLPAPTSGSVPVVLLLHGSSGLGLAAIGEWQRWLAGQGIASIAPDSFGLAGRLTYKSPIDKESYEKVHALRASEIGLALDALRGVPWADKGRLVLAGSSEGSPAVARHGGEGFVARMIFAWSCEDNYFVQSHRTAIAGEQPVLNVISSTDPFFSAANAWLGNPAAKGHCGTALKGNSRVSIVLLPDAPHTLINLPAARQAVSGFLKEVLAR